MKYTNHLRKLALLSSLALSFTVHADGTLPLPITESEVLPLKMEAERIELTVEISFMSTNRTAQPVSPTGIQPCAPTDEYYVARGTVTYNGIPRTVEGICKSKADEYSRTIVAIDAATVKKATQFILLEGRLDNVVSTQVLEGELKVKLFSGTAAPVIGTEAENARAFRLIRTQ